MSAQELLKWFERQIQAFNKTARRLHITEREAEREIMLVRKRTLEKLGVQ